MYFIYYGSSLGDINHIEHWYFIIFLFNSLYSIIILLSEFSFLNWIIDTIRMNKLKLNINIS